METRQTEITDAQEKLLTKSEGSREKRRRRAMALSGRFRSGVTDLSTEHDRYLDETLRFHLFGGSSSSTEG